ncbi:MAG: hypothetical protein AB7G88_10315, partial [Thermomicrobiales bacterium]
MSERTLVLQHLRAAVVANSRFRDPVSGHSEGRDPMLEVNVSTGRACPPETRRWPAFLRFAAVMLLVAG